MTSFMWAVVILLWQKLCEALDRRLDDCIKRALFPKEITL